MTLDAATRRNLELTETLRGGAGQGLAAGRAGPHGHADGQAPAAPVGQQAPAGRRPRSTGARTGSRCFYRERHAARRAARGAASPLADLERLTNRVISGQRPAARPGGDAQHAALPARPARPASRAGRRPLAAMLARLASLPATSSTCSKQRHRRRPARHPAEHRRHPPGLLRRAGRRGRALAPRPRLDRQPGSGASASAPGSSRSRWATTRSSATTSRSPTPTPSWRPADYIRKQTLVNAERYITPEMKEYETLVLNAEERIREIEDAPVPRGVRQAGGSASAAAGDGARAGRAGRAGLAGRGGRAERLRPPGGGRRKTCWRSATGATRWSSRA